MDVADMPAAVGEAARVLRAGGRRASRDDASFLVEGSSVEERDDDVPAARDGLELPFVSRRYPLGAYAVAYESAGLVLESLRELARGRGRWSRVPQFLHLRAVMP